MDPDSYGDTDFELITPMTGMANKIFKIFAVLVIFVSGAAAQTYSNLVPDIEIVEVVKHANKKHFKPYKFVADIPVWVNRSFFADTIRVDGSSFPFIHDGMLDNDSCKKYLSKADTAFMIKQSTAQTSALWRKADFENLATISKEEKDKSVEKAKMTGGRVVYYYHFSIPLFSLRRDFAVIHGGYWCGFICAGYCTYLFQWKKGHWVEVDEWNCIQS